MIIFYLFSGKIANIKLQDYVGKRQASSNKSALPIFWIGFSWVLNCFSKPVIFSIRTEIEKRKNTDTCVGINTVIGVLTDWMPESYLEKEP